MGGGRSAQLTQVGLRWSMIDQAGLGVNSVKSRLVDWILRWASLFIVFLK